MSETSSQDRIPITERLTGVALFLPVILSRALPYRWRVPVAGWLTARILAPLAGYSRRVRDNLAHVRPDLPAAEVRRLMVAVPDNVGRSMIELYSPEFFARMRDAPARGPGIDILRAAQAEGRPAVIVSGHIANFNAARRSLVEQGIDIACFYRAMSNRPFNAHYVRAMASVSEPIFEQSRAGVARMVRHLRKGGTVAIMNDLNAHDGLPLDFFGKPALTSLSAAEMALKYDAPLVPVWARRLENGLDFEVILEDEIPHTDPLTMTREFNRRLEAMVRANMDQWFWIHRRWKDGANVVGQMRAKQLEELERKLAGES
ncbi:LpxL/LpxP family acyltransferase [Roseovarius salis]|uniref:lysophospholipid acyltransferase family protein n=1 Tax=Roseovarius salis TaxID=3376063 RepID=UPI0037CABED8